MKLFNMKKFLLSACLLASLMLFSFASPVFAGLGISPSDWLESNGLAGQTMEKVFTLSRSNPDQDLYFTSEITGDIIPWIKIENGNSFVMKKGVQQLPVNVIVTIPKDAKYKNYKSEIRLKSNTNQVQTSGRASSVGVLLSSLIRIDLTVSDKPFLNYDVLQIHIPVQEVNKPIDVNLQIWTKGNVEAKPTKMTLEFYDKFNTTYLESKTITDFSALTGVGSFSEGTIVVPVPVSFAPEQYWAKINIYQDDNIIKSDEVTFDIVKQLPQNQVVVSQEPLRKGEWLSMIGWFSYVLITIGSLILLWAFVRFLMKRNPRPSKTGDTMVSMKDARKKVIAEVKESIDEFLDEKIKK